MDFLNNKEYIYIALFVILLYSFFYFYKKSKNTTMKKFNVKMVNFFEPVEEADVLFMVDYEERDKEKLNFLYEKFNKRRNESLIPSKIYAFLVLKLLESYNFSDGANCFRCTFARFFGSFPGNFSQVGIVFFNFQNSNNWLS